MCAEAMQASMSSSLVAKLSMYVSWKLGTLVTTTFNLPLNGANCHSSRHSAKEDLQGHAIPAQGLQPRSWAHLHMSAALSGSTSFSHCLTRLPQTPAQEDDRMLVQPSLRGALR